METVVEENPLSLATSRIVTMVLFIRGRFQAGDGLKSGERWRTLQQRVKAVSSSGLRCAVMVLVLACGKGTIARPMEPVQAGSPAAKSSGNQAPSADPKRLFEQGEAALQRGDLTAAERAFRGVLAANPGVAGAYANLGVIAMRRKQWPQALEML